MNTLESLRGQLIVSCQAAPDEPMHGAQHMAAMARAAIEGGAGGLRANGPDDIRAIRDATALPIIGIEKRNYPDSEVYITPTFESARRVVEAGATLVALDATTRPRPGGETLERLVAQIHGQLDVPVMADCSCMDDAAAAVAAGVDILATTLSGYTEHGRTALPGPDLEFISELAAAWPLPVIAEGRFEQPEQVAQAFERGAFAVVVGGAITRPQSITRRFASVRGGSGSRRYMSAVSVILDEVAANEGPAIAQAAATIGRSIRDGGTLYLFGTGHSHMMAEEGHYRAGGLASVVPILAASLMLHESAGASTVIERLPGVGRALLDRYAPQAGDCLIIFSNSGVNAAPVELAQAARERGLTVIAVQSTRYASATPPGAAGHKLAEYADLVIDNHLPKGDTLVRLGDTELKTGPGSTVVGAFILNAVLTEVIDTLVAQDGSAPIYISANLPGAGPHNEGLIAQYRPRNPHL